MEQNQKWIAKEPEKKPLLCQPWHHLAAMPLFGRPLHFLYRGTNVDTYFHNKLVSLVLFPCCLEDSDDIHQLQLSCSLRDTKNKSKSFTFYFFVFIVQIF